MLFLWIYFLVLIAALTPLLLIICGDCFGKKAQEKKKHKKKKGKRKQRRSSRTSDESPSPRPGGARKIVRKERSVIRSGLEGELRSSTLADSNIESQNRPQSDGQLTLQLKSQQAPQLHNLDPTELSTDSRVSFSNQVIVNMDYVKELQRRANVTSVSQYLLKQAQLSNKAKKN